MSVPFERLEVSTGDGTVPGVQQRRRCVCTRTCVCVLAIATILVAGAAATCLVLFWPASPPVAIPGVLVRDDRGLWGMCDDFAHVDCTGVAHDASDHDVAEWRERGPEYAAQCHAPLTANERLFARSLMIGVHTSNVTASRVAAHAETWMPAARRLGMRVVVFCVTDECANTVRALVPAIDDVAELVSFHWYRPSDWVMTDATRFAMAWAVRAMDNDTGLMIYTKIDDDTFVYPTNFVRMLLDIEGAPYDMVAGAMWNDERVATDTYGGTGYFFGRTIMQRMRDEDKWCAFGIPLEDRHWPQCAIDAGAVPVMLTAVADMTGRGTRYFGARFLATLHHVQDRVFARRAACSARQALSTRGVDAETLFTRWRDTSNDAFCANFTGFSNYVRCPRRSFRTTTVPSFAQQSIAIVVKVNTSVPATPWDAAWGRLARARGYTVAEARIGPATPCEAVAAVFEHMWAYDYVLVVDDATFVHVDNLVRLLWPRGVPPFYGVPPVPKVLPDPGVVTVAGVTRAVAAWRARTDLAYIVPRAARERAHQGKHPWWCVTQEGYERPFDDWTYNMVTPLNSAVYVSSIEGAPTHGTPSPYNHGVRMAAADAWYAIAVSELPRTDEIPWLCEACASSVLL